MKKITCEFCGEEFEEFEGFDGKIVSAEEAMENSEQHMCMSCGNRQDAESCEKLNGECISCYEPEE